MLSFEEFCLKIEEEFKNYLSGEYASLSVKILDSKIGEQVVKVFFLSNGDKNVNVPVFPVKSLYNDLYIANCKGNIEAFFKLLAPEYEKQYRNAVKASFKQDKSEKVNIEIDNVFFVLINYNDNKEYLKNIPYDIYGEFAVVFRVLIDDNSDDFQSILISNDVLKNFIDNGYSFDDIKEAAYKNTPRIFPEKLIRISEDCYMLTNENYSFGASVIMYENNSINELSERTGKNVVIIPYSINSVFLVLVDDVSVLDLENYNNELLSVSNEFGETALNSEIVMYSGTTKKLLFGREMITMDNPKKVKTR